MNDLVYSLSNGDFFNNSNMNERSKNVDIQNENAYNRKKSINPIVLKKELINIYEKFFQKQTKFEVQKLLDFEVLKLVGIILLAFGLILLVLTGVPNLLLFLLF